MEEQAAGGGRKDCPEHFRRLYNVEYREAFRKALQKY
jgi:hypothetical protein